MVEYEKLERERAGQKGNGVPRLGRRMDVCPVMVKTKSISKKPKHGFASKM